MANSCKRIIDVPFFTKILPSIIWCCVSSLWCVYGEVMSLFFTYLPWNISVLVLSDQVLQLERLLVWRWLLYPPSQSSPIFILQRMRWSTHYLICNLKSGAYLLSKIVYLSTCVCVTSTFEEFLLHKPFSLAPLICCCRDKRYFTTRTLAHWWSCR